MTATTAETLVDLVVIALTDATDAQDRVEAYRAWPLQSPYQPCITIDLPEEDKEGLAGRSNFNTTAAITVRGYVCSQSPGAALNTTLDGGEIRVRQALMNLRRQIEVAVINNPGLAGSIKMISGVHTKMQASQDGNGYHLAELAMQLLLQFYQDPTDFAPFSADEIDTLHLDVQPVSPAGIDIPIDIPLT